MATSNKKPSVKLNKQQKSNIVVWSEINQMMVDKYKPVESKVIEVLEQTNPISKGQQQIIDVLQQANRQLVDNNNTINSTTNKVVKADIGRQIFDEEMAKNNGGVPIRSTTIKRLMSEAGLTQNGAATYYQNMKKKAGMVVSKS